MKKISAYEKFLNENNLRRKEAKKLRKQGLSWAAIGLHLGVTRQRAQQLGAGK
jgi:predicted transcriptional regulator